MKKMLAVLLVMMGMLSGCVSDPTEDMKNPQSAPQSESDTQKQEEEKSIIPGDYTVPEGWVKSEDYSNARQIFYIEEGKEGSTQPDNISINVGENKYSAEEHTKFKDAIVRQIMMQIQGQGVELDGTGTHTKQDYVVYIFTIKEETGIVTKQYYIVDDYRFCLIQLTNFTGSEAANEAAQQMVDSFVWNNKEEEAAA